MQKYVGIADTEGLESIMPEDVVSPTELHMMLLRARFNPHRKAMVYRAELPPITYRAISREMKRGEYRGALLILKECSPIIELTNKQAKEWWDDIPHFTATELSRLRIKPVSAQLVKTPMSESDDSQLTMFGDQDEV